MVGILERLIFLARAGIAQDPLELAEVQERGFALLVSLEASLQRVRKPSATPDGANSPEAEELRKSIVTLREALTELRVVSDAQGEPRIGYGFVLPRGR